MQGPRQTHVLLGLVWFAALLLVGCAVAADIEAPPLCGDGSAETGEQCDDGNLVDGDGCSALCQFEAAPGYCGNSVVDDGETCDDGNLVDGDGCSRDCVREDAQPIGACGNGVAEHGEDCDGADTAGESCATQGFGGGILACSADCKLDTARCLAGAGCGNAVIDAGEECDPPNLNHTTCVDLGYDGGTLGCSACQFDESFCTSSTSVCGNGVVEAGESCDGADLAGETCESQGLGAGALACRADCHGFKVSDCGATAACGDGILNGTEDCDGADLAHEDCASLGFARGTLKCSVACRFDTSSCEASAGSCGNGVIDAGEQCDGTRLGGQTCVSQGFVSGNLACGPDCTGFDTRNCATTTVPPGWTCAPDTYGASDGCDCGCGVLDPDCPDRTVASCDLCGAAGSCNSGPCPGTITPGNNVACNAAVGVCGDGVIGTGEACDGANLNSQSCTSRGFSAGTLACAVNCLSFDTSGCSGATVPASWTCAADFYGTDDGCDCGCGALDPDCVNASVGACAYCYDIGSCGMGTCPTNIDPANNAVCVTTSSCGNGALDASESCDGANLGGATCASLGFASGTLSCAADCRGFVTSGCISGGVPAAWTCSDLWYDDGSDCDCGCGALDPDCASAAVASCDYCSDSGSCNTGSCPGSIDVTHNWQCGSSTGSCGNGAVDAGEVCDGSNFGSATCASLGYSGGTLACAGNCQSLVTSGCTGTAVPSGWTCNRAYYDANDGCDCDCGAYDPDCDDPSAYLFGCASGESCDASGHCVGGSSGCGNGALDAGEVCDGSNLDGKTCVSQGFAAGTLACAADCKTFNTSLCTSGGVPIGWNCSASYYDANDGCDCDCGAWDPDCADSSQRLYGCATGQTCNSAGQCVSGGPSCGNGALDAGEVCDGAALNGKTCATQGFRQGVLTCQANCSAFNTSGCSGQPLPAGWTCPVTYFEDGEFCDCECGAYDADCDDPTLPVDGCFANEACDAQGHCTGAVVPSTWSCDPNYYDASDGCDCECGAYDPDCDDPNATIYNCYVWEICDGTGHCW